MPYVVVKHPAVRMDIMVQQQYWPKMVSLIQRTGCQYFKEDWAELPNGNRYVILRDVRGGKQLPGRELGDLMGLLYGLEWQALTDPDLKDLDNKFYILIKPRKKGKKNAEEDRKEAGPGREGGAGGESAGDIRSERADRDGDGGYRPFSIGPDDIRGLEVLEGGEDFDDHH